MMRKLFVFLILVPIVAAGCKSGKPAEVKDDSRLDTALQVKVEGHCLMV